MLLLTTSSPTLWADSSTRWTLHDSVYRPDSFTPEGRRSFRQSVFHP